MIKQLVIHLALTVSVISILNAQSDSTDRVGKVVSEEFLIQKRKQIDLPVAKKLSFPIVIKERTSDSLKLSFQFIEPDLSWPAFNTYQPKIVFQKEYPLATNQNYARLGFGNYNSPLVDLFYQKRLRSYAVASKVFYERFNSGAINSERSGSSTLTINVAGSGNIGEHIIITPALEMKTFGYEFYGNTDRLASGYPNLQESNARFTQTKAAIELSGNKNFVRYFVKPGFEIGAQTGQRINSNKENEFNVSGGFNVDADSMVTFGISSRLHTSMYNGGTIYKRSLFGLAPNVTYQTEKLTLSGKIDFITQNQNGNSTSGIYPDLGIKYKTSQKGTILGKIGSGVDWNNLTDFLTQNPFLDDSLLLQNQRNVIYGEMGYETRNIAHLKLSASTSFRSDEELGVFIPAENDSSKYVLKYDSAAMQTFSIKAGAIYQKKSTQKLEIDLIYNAYNTESLIRPWHLPAFQMNSSFHQQFSNKVWFRLDLMMLGGLEAPIQSEFGIKKLPTIVDSNVSVEYKLSEKFGAFFIVNNMLGQTYERYLGYPVRGLSLKIGGQYRF